ncbi:MAG: alpha/beta hydrolase fold domain-containing protein [Planctomycetota bacterium]|jgi:acetyl esterase/lipase
MTRACGRAGLVLSGVLLVAARAAPPGVAETAPPPASPPVPPEIVLVRDVVYASVAAPDGTRRELVLDAACPADVETPLPVVLYIHGGGWQRGAKEQGEVFIRAFARGGYLAVSVGYRLSGEAPFPAAVHDCKAAVRFLRAHAGELGVDPDRIGAWGHSAGGHLAALLATSADVPALDGELGGDDVSTAVRCAATVSGPADLTRGLDGRGAGMVRRWLGDGDRAEVRRRARAASPVTWVDAGDPPMLIVHGTADRLVPVAQARRLRDALAGEAVEVELHLVEDGGHGLRDAEAYRRIAAFFDAHLGGHATGALEQLRAARPGRR